MHSPRCAFVLTGVTPGPQHLSHDTRYYHFSSCRAVRVFRWVPFVEEENSTTVLSVGVFFTLNSPKHTTSCPLFAARDRPPGFSFSVGRFDTEADLDTDTDKTCDEVRIEMPARLGFEGEKMHIRIYRHARLCPIASTAMRDMCGRLWWVYLLLAVGKWVR